MILYLAWFLVGLIGFINLVAGSKFSPADTVITCLLSLILAALVEIWHELKVRN